MVVSLDFSFFIMGMETNKREILINIRRTFLSKPKFQLQEKIFFLTSLVGVVDG